MAAGPYRVDLHLHTTYSDGLDTPAELVAKAAACDLRTIAITDHDTTAGVAEAQQTGRQYGLDVLSGVELTVQYESYHDIHVLGYLFDAAHPSVQGALSRMQTRRVQRGLEILERVNERLRQRGAVALAPDDVLRRASGALTRPHLAQELVAQAHVTTIEEAFREFLIPCDVPKAHLHPEEAFALIRQAGGLCSLAHPGILSADPVVLDHLMVTFKAMGMSGIEVYHHCHYPEQIDFFRARARRYGLIATGGSDYHGRPFGACLGEIGPGYPIPDAVLMQLRQAAALAC
jgi:predicted metal-dependent phosphoesterase TrpH